MSTTAAETELLDRPDLPLHEAHRALRDLRRVNRVLFGCAVAGSTMRPLIRSHEGPATLLDVAAGSGDVAATVARAENPGVRVVSLDRRLRHLVLGRALGDVRNGVVACATALPFADDSVTWSLSTFFLHHLDEAGKRQVCTEMERVSARGVVIVDLMPTWWARLLARVVLPALRLGRVARLDGYVSLRRSWPASRWRRFLGDHRCAQVRTRFPARVTIVLGTES